MRRQTTSQFPLSPGGWPHHGRLPRPARPLCRHEQWSRFRPSGRPNGVPDDQEDFPSTANQADREREGTGTGNASDESTSGSGNEDCEGPERRRDRRQDEEQSGQRTPQVRLKRRQRHATLPPRASEHIDGQLQIN